MGWIQYVVDALAILGGLTAFVIIAVVVGVLRASVIASREHDDR